MPRAGIQVIIYGERNRTDAAGVIRDAAGAGFAGVETGNLFRQMGDEEAVRRLFEQAGVVLAGCHAGFPEFRDEGRLEENLHYLEAMGGHYLMCSGAGDRSRGLAAYREACRLFNAVGRRCRERGVVFCYHNHAWEFEDREGDSCGMDVIAAETDPALVRFCLDVYWLHHAGEDPAAFVRRHAERGGYYHFKDGVRRDDGAPHFRELGAGAVDLRAAYAAAQEAGAEWIVYEQDRSDGPPEESVRRSRAYLRQELGI